MANSIGIDKKGRYLIHSPSRWSEAVRNKYHWFAYYPWELAYTTSLLKKHTKHKVRFLDGCLMRLNQSAYLKEIIRERPDMMIIETATRMIDENLDLALQLKKSLGTKIVFVGQHASAFPEELINKGVDYVCIGEYEYTLLELVQGKDTKNILGLYPNQRRELLDVNDLPWPEDEDVSRLDYGKPGEPSSEFFEIQMYGSRGCPGSCNFCVARHVYYACANWRARNIKDIIKEIIYLKKKYPVMQGIFFDEEVHNGKKEFIMELTQAIIANGLNELHFEAMCDVRFLDEEILTSMKKAGYYKVRIGIETASEKTMDAINKKIYIDGVKEKLNYAKKIGIKTYGTFIFGAADSDMAEDQKTITLIKDLINDDLLDNLQLSICTPQPGTPFYQFVADRKFLRDNLEFESFDGGSSAVVSYPGYSWQAIEKMKRRALLMRDHLFLQKKIKNRSFWKWLYEIYYKYGFWGLIEKAVHRLITEMRFQLER